MKDSRRVNITAVSLVVLVLALLVFGYASYVEAGNTPPAKVQSIALAGPTPITTPSALDALTTTSNIAVGGDLTVAGTTTLANVTRRISFPLFSFVECDTNAATAIKFTDGTDALPNFANSSTDGLGGVIRFDDTGSSEDEGTEICNQFMVPPDYASGGEFTIRALKNGHTTAESEDINCAVSVNGGALQTVGTVEITAAASAAYTCTPTIAALAAGDSVSFYLSITSETGGAEPIDDTVDIAAVGFTYTALR